MRPSSILWTWPNPRSLRCLSRVTYWEVQHETGHQRWLLCPARICPEYGGCFSGECVEPTLLPGICSPCLAAIQQCADNTGNLDRHICLHRQLGPCPHSIRATSESWSCLPNPLVDLCVQREVVGDCGAEVGELADSIEFVIVIANDRGCVCVLFRGHSSSSNWWSVRSPYRPVRSSPSMLGIPPGCGSQMLRHQQTACPWWEPRIPLYWLWYGRGWRACHLSGYEGRLLLLLCLRYVLATGQWKSQRALEQGRSLVWRYCGFRMAPRSCHWTALFPSCQYGKTRSCSAVWVGNRSLGEP